MDIEEQDTEEYEPGDREYTVQFEPGDRVTITSTDGAHFLEVGTEAHVIDDFGYGQLMVYGTTVEEFGRRKAPQFVSVDDVERTADLPNSSEREYERGDQVRVHERAYHRFPPNTVAKVERSWLDQDGDEVLLLKVGGSDLPDEQERGLGQFVYAHDVEPA